MTKMKLLKPVLKEQNEQVEVQHERVKSRATKFSEQYLTPVKKRDYQKQYFHIYGQRLEALRERVAECVRAESGQDVTIKRLSELDEIEEGRSVVVIGTLFKNQVLKPNILKEVGEDNAASNETNDDEKDSLAKFIDDSDELVLEDDLQRARLYFPTDNDQKYDVDQFVSGIVCGIFGYMIPSEQREGGGRFCVKKMFFPAIPEHPNTSQPSKENVRCVALMSGLNLSENTSVAELGSINLVSEFILGECGDMDTQKQNSQFDRIILAGNHLSSDTRDRKILRTAKYLTTGQSARSVNAVHILDDILEELASGIEVDVMPGWNDPANQNLPQQPLHLCLFPKASMYSTLNSVTNPYHVEISGFSILGTSGQNIEDIMKNSSISDPIEALEAIIKWSHMAPTCPDTLGCVPYLEKDPFVLKNLPHVFFAGNQEKFAQKKLILGDGKQVLLLAIPSFVDSKTMVQLNLSTMEAIPIIFSLVE